MAKAGRLFRGAGRGNYVLALVLALACFGDCSQVTRFRSGIVEYKVSDELRDMLDVILTTVWAPGGDEMLHVCMDLAHKGYDLTYLFGTFEGVDSVHSSPDAASSTDYKMIRNIGTIPLPDEKAEIFVQARFNDSNYPVRMATLYIPGVRASIVAQIEPLGGVIINQASPGAYAFAFVPATSSHGVPIECSIIAHQQHLTSEIEPDELTAAAVASGCRIGWKNSRHSIGATMPVGLRISEPATGHYIDLSVTLTISTASGALV